MAVLVALIAVVAAISAGGEGSAFARGRRRPLRRHPPKPAPSAVVLSAPTPTVLIPRRLLVLGFDGRGAQVPRSAVVARLRKIPSLRLVPLHPADALRIGTAYGAGKSVDLAKHLNLTALLYGQLASAKRSLRLRLWLTNGEDGEVVGEIVIEARTPAALRAKIQAQLWDRLEPLVDRSASPGPAAPSEPTPRAAGTPAPVAPRTAKAPEKGATDATTAGRTAGTTEGTTEGTRDEAETPSAQAPPIVLTPPLLTAAPRPTEPADSGEIAPAPSCPLVDLEPGAGLMIRRFNYQNEQRGALRGYTLYRAAVGGVGGTVYPFGGGPCRPLSALGLRIGYERMASVTARLATQRLASQASDYDLQLVFRIVRGTVTLQPAIGYFAREYSVDAGVVPAAAYRSVGAGVDAEIRVRFVRVELGGGVRRLLSIGTLDDADWFPGASGIGLAARARLGLALNPWLDILAGASVEYDSFDLHIVPGSAYPNGVASGAYDLYLQGGLSVRVHLGLGTRDGHAR